MNCPGRCLPLLPGLLAGLLAPAVAWAQEARSAPPPYVLPSATGTHMFRALLHRQHCRPLKRVDDLEQEPQTKLLIVLGETDVLSEVHPTLRGFVERGGAVLVATDRDTPEGLKGFDGTEVRGLNVQVAPDSVFAYRHVRDCIFVEAAGADVPIFGRLRAGDADYPRLTRVATNRPGCLIPGELPVLATFPKDCGVLGVRARLPSPLAFAAGKQVGNGRILVLSDHSVFINAMLWQLDNANLEFTLACLDWLSESGQRSEVLFVEEDQIQDTFDVPLKYAPPTMPPLEAILQAVDGGIAGLEQEERLSDIVAHAAERVNLPILLRALLMVLSAGLVIYGLARLSQARHRVEPVASLVAAGLGGPVEGKVLEARQRAMVQAGNFWEAARTLARRELESALGFRPEVAADPAGQPVIRAEGTWWNRWRLRRQAYWLWQLAYGPEPVPISSRRLARLRAELDAVKAALASGNLEIVEAPELAQRLTADRSPRAPLPRIGASGGPSILPSLPRPPSPNGG